MPPLRFVGLSAATLQSAASRGFVDERLQTRRGAFAATPAMSFDADSIVRLIHLIAAAVWVGSMVTLAVVAPQLVEMRLTGAEAHSITRAFGAVGFPAMIVAIGTGIWRIAPGGVEITTPLVVKIVLASFAVLMAIAYARRTPATRPHTVAWMRFWLLVAALGLMVTSAWL